MTDSSRQSRSRGRATRVSVSLNDDTLDLLQTLAAQESRSLSNLCARLIESALRNGMRAD